MSQRNKRKDKSDIGLGADDNGAAETEEVTEAEEVDRLRQ